jgi:hypothetical protein
MERDVDVARSHRGRGALPDKISLEKQRLAPGGVNRYRRASGALS